MRHRGQKSTTGPERRKERETFCVRYGKWTRFLRWRTQLHKTTRLASRFSIYIALLDVLESRVMKRTSISYCAVWEYSRADILGSKTSQCEVMGLWARVQLHKNDSLVSRFSIYTTLLDVIESRVMKRTSIRYCAVRSFGLRWQSQYNFCNYILLKNFYHYNVYIIMIFFIFILKHHDINVSRSFSF